nr:hypothetical protein [Nonomuraea gerenzanensis]
MSRQRPASSRSSPSRSPRSGSAVRIRPISAGSSPVPNGGRPVAAATMVPAQANRSAAGPAGPPPNCSGAMYGGVPTRCVPSPSRSSSAREMPKSITRGPSLLSSTLPGLKSRCTTPAWWMAASAVSVPMARRRSSAPRSGPRSRITVARDGPSTYSLTTYGVPRNSPLASTCAVQNALTRRA